MNKMTLKEFNKRYQYETDISKYGRVEHWTVIPKDKVMKGDCEDYVLTLKESVQGYENLELYFCRVGQIGHCIGKIDGMWIDCNFKGLRVNLPESYHSVVKYTKYQIFLKKVKAWFQRVLKW